MDGFGAFLPGLSIAASAPRSANKDSDLLYTYLVKNSGDSAVNNTTVTIVVPDDTRFDSMITPPGVTCNYNSTNRTVTCDLGTLNPTASSQFQMKVHIDPTAKDKVSHGNYSVKGQGVSPLIGPLVETTLSTGVAYADLAVSLSDGVVGVGWDRPVHYTLVASNNGPTAVTGATLQDTFPPELTAVTWTCTATGGATCAAPSGTGPISTTTDLPPGGKVTYSIDAKVVPGSGSGTLVNRAQITPPAGISDPDDTNNVAVDSDGIGTLVTLTVDKDPTGGGQGTLTSSPAAIQCDADCTTRSADVPAGAPVSLTATAAPGSVFVGWSGGCTGTTNPCTVSPNQATSVTARFEPIQYTISTSSGPGGTLTCPPTATYGQSVTCTVTVDPGYQLSSLTDNGSQVSSSVSGGQYVIVNVTGPHELSALFTERPGTRPGGACTTNSECSTGFCADGVCCNTACDGQCEACNAMGSAGTCGAVTGAPRGGHPACGSDGTVCGGVCDGTVRTTCAYPQASVTCGTASCSEGVALLGGTCNGAGACTQETQDCGDFACGDNACYATCTTDAQCSDGALCVSGECKARSSLLVEGSGCSSTGGAGAGLPLLLSSLALWLRRRRSAVAAAAVAVVPAAAQAQEDPSRSFQVERFQAQPGRDDLLGVQSARVPEHLSFSGRLFVDYANQPLRLVSSNGSGYQRLLVRRQAYLTLAGSVALFDRFELGAAIPVLLSQSTGGASVVGNRIGGEAVSTALSDLRLNLKAALLRSENLGLSLALPFSFPTAPGDSYTGGGSVTFNPTIIGEWRAQRGSALMANLGLYLARPQQFLNLHLGTALTYGVGAKVDLVPKWKLALLGTVAGEVGLSQPSVPTNPLELLLALRWSFLKNLEATVGGGPGLTNGYGTPRYRLLAALSYAPSDSAPRPKPAPAPEPAPVVTAPPPPPPPPAIAARDDAGQVLAGQSIDLKVLGNDEGQSGESLRVSDVGSAKGGRVETAADGTLRYTARADFSGQDTFTYRVAGQDGRTAEAKVVVTVTAPPPPPAPSKVVVEKGKLRTLEKVYFATAKDNATAESLPILDQVYEVLRTNPDIKKLRIEAHTDNAGKASYNKELSARRAKWVREYLIQKGIAPERLTSEGFGMTKPIDTNDTPEGRANNRRVEFVVVE